MKVASFKAPSGLIIDLDWLSHSLRTTRSEVVRRAIQGTIEYVRKHGKLPRVTYTPIGDSAIISFKVNEELIKNLDELAYKLSVPRSTLIRTAVYYYVAMYSKHYSPHEGRHIRVYIVGSRPPWR
jgi:metal-responsive CopG/Arc/MetJ family transcriptional regulator